VKFVRVSGPLKLKKTSQPDLEVNGRIGAVKKEKGNKDGFLLVVEYFDWTEKGNKLGKFRSRVHPGYFCLSKLKNKKDLLNIISKSKFFL
jgi:hypothetical protein